MRISSRRPEPDVQIYLVVAVIALRGGALGPNLRSQERHAAGVADRWCGPGASSEDATAAAFLLIRCIPWPLVNTDPRAAQRMICSLGDLLRMSLMGGAPEVTLRRELEFLKVLFRHPVGLRTGW